MEAIEQIKQHGLNNLAEIEPNEVYGCDLHHELYNMDYFIIGTYKARMFLNEVDVFSAIGTVKEYEQDNFGEVSTDLTDPEKVANMYAYIVGEEILQESDTLQDFWNDLLTAEALEQIKSEIE